MDINMIKNMLIAFLVVMNIGWATIMFAQVAFADRDRDRKFTYIGKAGWCTVYGYQGVFVAEGKDCAIAAR